MSRTLILLVYILSLLCGEAIVNAQTTVLELKDLGDAAYEKGNYASAVHFYKLIVNEESRVKRNVTFPYEMMHFTGKKAKIKEGQNSDTTNSSINANEENQHTVHKVRKDEKYATQRIAECLRILNSYDEAEEWYRRSLKLNWGEEAYNRDHFWYANILMNNSKYAEAEQVLENYVVNRMDSSQYYMDRAEKLMDDCKYARSNLSKKTGFSVKKIDSTLNNGNSNYATGFYGKNELIFSSAREESIPNEAEGISGIYLSDLYTSRRSGDAWDKPIPLNNTGVNTFNHEGAASVSVDKSIMFFTRWGAVSAKKELPSIYSSRFFSDRWMQPQKADKINVSGYRSMQPTLSKNGKFLFFSSEMPGGKGGLDIWYCTVSKNGTLGEPVNLGDAVNTAEDEVSPFYHDKTKTLYFSSNGHKGIGGLDVFKSSVDMENGSVGIPINMGFPINSARNESYLIIDDEQKEGFFTSNRNNCSDCNTGNCNELYTFEKSENKFSLSGVVYDVETEKPLANSRITIKDIKGSFDPVYLETDGNGAYTFPMQQDMHIFIKAQKLEYFADADVISTIEQTDSKDMKKDFYLELIPYEEIVIKGIEYDYNKATLRPISRKIIDTLVDFLTLNDNLIIEISSHTDSRGSDSYNFKLSQQRAESVVKYLVEKGIAKERLLPKGYGEKKLLIKDAKTEEEHQRNRRTSFRTLSENYEPIDKYRPKN